MAIHTATVLGELKGTLMTLDIDDVEVGDVIFMGGHLVRRVATKPAAREHTSGGESFRQWAAVRLNDPFNLTGEVTSFPRNPFQTAAGTAVLILRPAS